MLNLLLLFSIHTAEHVFRGTRPCKSVNKTKANIRFWAWFSSEGAGSIELLNHLSKEQFAELLEEELVSKVASRFGSDPVAIFDDSKSAEAIINQLPRAVFKELKWPPKSGHLSPFVTIWSHIEKSIHLQRRQPQNAVELWEYVTLMWEKRSEQPLFWKGLTQHLSIRLQSIAAAEGELTEAEKD
jgi:hypothetical protein